MTVKVVKKLFLLVLLFNTASVLKGEVSVRVCLADGNTPLELVDPNIPFIYRDIMAGTRLTIIVSSDANGFWSGSLIIFGDDRSRGFLSARDTTDNRTGSCLPAAGNRTYIWSVQDLEMQAIGLEVGRDSMAGDWFIIDYTALNIGVCTVVFYDDSNNSYSPVIPVIWEDPITYYLVFSQVPTRDFNNDTKVDFTDFAVLASNWQRTDCMAADGCASFDLNIDGNIDLDDLILFTEFWLESTE
jgi:hypothetical protein